MSAIESTIFWLELFWTPSLVITGYLLLPRPGDRSGQFERYPTDEP
jgi:hypothetical protein